MDKNLQCFLSGLEFMVKVFAEAGVNHTAYFEPHFISKPYTYHWGPDGMQL